MVFHRKLHNRRYPPGLETTVLKRLPWVFAASIFIPFGYALGPRLFSGSFPAQEFARVTSMAEILAIAAFLTVTTLLSLVGIGCIIVRIMKGPAYQADSHPAGEFDLD
ncbi:MAG: hypothetical protein AAFX85_12890 [Pseudomonadota bacterium]